MRPDTVLVAGATGYVGGRLIPRLLERGYRVRAMARTPVKAACKPWAGHPNLEIVPGDVLDETSLTEAVAGCRTAYYLVHSMNPTAGNFADLDRRAAKNMAAASSQEGLKRIIYLGGLGAKGSQLSPHLRSRLEVAEILRSGAAHVTFLRAAAILGSGSASFEILRYLVDRLPVMITPRWVRTPCQPIAIRNVIAYLVGCLEHHETENETFDICGPDILTYEDLFKIYAEEAGLPRRVIISVPLLTPKLSSYWVSLVTPIPAALAKPLAMGLRNTVVCGDHRIRSIIPQELLSCREAINVALERVKQQKVETCWSDAGYTCPPEWMQSGDAEYAGGSLYDCAYRIRLKASPRQVWEPVRRLGGETGWYFANYLWRLRGWIDSLLGGVGLRRGRRSPVDISVGDALDFWRVLEVQEEKRLLLLAEMKLPGEATLEFRLEPLPDGEIELRQISRFLPRGLWGILYWFSTYPLHKRLFAGMLKSIARAAGRPITKQPERFIPMSVESCSFSAPTYKRLKKD